MSKFQFDSVDAVESWLAGNTDFEKMTRFAYHERAFNLDRTRALLAALGDPQRSFRTVHVAGTKGKGSVSHMVSAILSASGRRTGLFTSPHLVSILERVRIDGEPASPAGFCRDMAAVAGACAAIAPKMDEQPTFFERMLALSVLHHANEGVTRAVYEVGLGGRLDATNVLLPEVCVITKLGLDHTHVLGSTLALIAAEKAGIIKPGVPVVAAASDREGMMVIEQTARAQAAPLLIEGRDFGWAARRREDGGIGIEVDVEGPGFSIRGAQVPLAGLHQGQNAAVAAVACRLFADSTGDGFDPSAVAAGLRSVRVPGRLEQVCSNPILVVDVAHNQVSVEAGVKALAGFWPGKRVIALVGLSADKDAAAILGALCPACAGMIFTSAGNPRSAEPSALAAIAAGLGFHGTAAEPDFGVAFERFLSSVPGDGVGLVTGSFFMAGRAMKSLGLQAGGSG